MFLHLPAAESSRQIAPARSENRRQSGPGSARRWIPLPNLHAAGRAHDIPSAGCNMYVQYVQ